jgi:hypothetical protein
MKIAIIGAGNVGTRLGALFAAAGHQVAFGVRANPPVRPDIGAGPIAEAAADADIVVLAVPFTACAGILPPLRDTLAGKIVIDATNPLNADWSPLPLGHENSAAEEIARFLPGARVVKAFNTVFADVMTPQLLRRGDRAITVFVAGDAAAACERVADLARSAGFAPVMAGPLKAARYLEAMAHLNIGIAVGEGGGTNAAFLYDQVRA